MKNIVDNNKLIAEFMGLSYCKKHLYEGWYKNHEHNHRLCDFNGLKYHSSWDWLMKVVEKIEQSQDVIGFTIFGDSRNYYQVTIKQYQKTGRNTISNVEGKSKIEAVYIAVVEFIKWYNEQK